jgi:hypothetical protein
MEKEITYFKTDGEAAKSIKAQIVFGFSDEWGTHAAIFIGYGNSEWSARENLLYRIEEFKKEIK